LEHGWIVESRGHGDKEPGRQPDAERGGNCAAVFGGWWYIFPCNMGRPEGAMGGCSCPG
jgi:hypothetical protein